MLAIADNAEAIPSPHRRIVRVLGAIALLAATTVHGASSSSHQISAADLGISGGTSSSGSHALTSCIGSTIAGSAASGSYRMEASCGMVANAAPFVVAAACGTANGVAASSAPTANLCAAGTASAVLGSGPWNWSCSAGSASVSCSAPLLAPIPAATIPTLSTWGALLLAALLALTTWVLARRRAS